jgi:hypothetical protein
MNIPGMVSLTVCHACGSSKGIDCFVVLFKYSWLFKALGASFDFFNQLYLEKIGAKYLKNGNITSVPKNAIRAVCQIRGW